MLAHHVTGVVHRGEAVELAVAAAACIAVGAVARQRICATASERGAVVIGSAARQPMWWAGTVAGLAGYGLQAAALARGSLLVVQPLLMLSLLFALPLSALLAGRAVTVAQWAWAAALTVAVAAVAVLGTPQRGSSHAPLSRWVLVGTVGVVLVAGCWYGARGGRGPRRALLLGTVSGALFGVAAALTKGVMATATHHPSRLASSPEVYVLIVVAAIAIVTQQDAYSAGAVEASLPAATVAEPIVSLLLAVTVLGESLRLRGWEVALLVSALAVMVAASIALAVTSARADRPAGVRETIRPVAQGLSRSAEQYTN
ncbi:DMT family transporter [Nocardia sp. NPDC004068]|uniref:DMT family transporter n=1 Tax=Nocardia sp. NPDC004068 TaxID=3364303 RepID=UPI0036C4EDC5